jgi:hypothetical protein
MIPPNIKSFFTLFALFLALTTFTLPGAQASPASQVQTVQAAQEPIPAELINAIQATKAQFVDSNIASFNVHSAGLDFILYSEQQFIAADGGASDHFGWWVVHDGDMAVVAAPMDDIDANIDQGSVYVLTRDGTTWSVQQKLTASDGAAGDVFGYSVALLNDDTLLVGAYADDVGGNVDQGSVYFFTRSGSTWSEVLHLFAPDGGGAYECYGRAVALSGDTALVGSYGDFIGGNQLQGSVFVYIQNESSWDFQQKLTALDGAANDQFGWALALDGDTALVGAYIDDVIANTNQGSAYIFERDGAIWTQQAHLIAPDGAAGDEFGVSVAIDDDTALVGTWGMVSGAVRPGSVYVFTRAETIWSLQQTLTASDGVPGDHLGYAVALEGDTALVGAPWDDVSANIDQGSVYVFTRSGTHWNEQAHVIASDGGASDRYGMAVSLSGTTALVGSYLHDVSGSSDQGSAYFYLELHRFYSPLMLRSPQ